MNLLLTWIHHHFLFHLLLSHARSLAFIYSPNKLKETVKTRMQVSGLGVAATCKNLYVNEGVSAFWKGLVFAYGRELSYTSIKLGAYAPVRDALGAGKDAPFYLKFLAGAITGGVGSFIGNPFDVMKTLSQTNKDKAVPLGTLVGDMYKNQGIAGFYRGVEANVARACVLNATKMGCYDLTKGYVTEYSKFSTLLARLGRRLHRQACHSCSSFSFFPNLSLSNLLLSNININYHSWMVS